MHALRHYFASVLLDAGEIIRAVSDYLGHSDPGFTFRVYTHIMPSSDDRTERAIDAAFSGSRDRKMSEIRAIWAGQRQSSTSTTTSRISCRVVVRWSIWSSHHHSAQGQP